MIGPVTLQDFVFDDIAEEPVPSILRGFSAPVSATARFTCHISNSTCLKCHCLLKTIKVFFILLCCDGFLQSNYCMQVKLVFEQSDEDLAFLMGHDTDR